MKFTVDRDRGGQPTWRLSATNGEQVAWAGESFASVDNAKRAATAFKNGAAQARYEIYADAAGHWRWRAWRSSDKVASSGEAFDSRANAERAAENVKVNAGAAEGP